MARSGKWERAPDIGRRIAALRQLLGETQEVFGERWAVGPDQVSEWELGKSKPPRSRVELAAKTNGWPLEVFQEGGPDPVVVMGSPLADRDAQGSTVGEGWADYRASAPLTEQGERIARAIAAIELGLAELRAATESQRDRATAGDAGEVAETGHPSRQRPARRQGKSG